MKRKLFLGILILLLLATSALALVPSEQSSVSYDGDGSTTQFAYPFRVTAEDQLRVILADKAGLETTLKFRTEYTVIGVGELEGGTVTLRHPPDRHERLIILRAVPMTQDTDYIQNAPLNAEILEKNLDHLTFMAQQLKEMLQRALLLPVSSRHRGLVLPDPAGGPGKPLIGNPTGDGFVFGEAAATSYAYTLSLQNKYHGDLTTAVAHLGSAPTTLVVDGPGYITANTMVPETLRLEFFHPGAITGKGGTWQLTINNMNAVETVKNRINSYIDI